MEKNNQDQVLHFTVTLTDKEKETKPVSLEERQKVVEGVFGKGLNQFPVVERLDIPEIPREIEMAQPVPGAATRLTQSVTDDQTGQVLVSNSGDDATGIVLPLTEEEIREGTTHKMVDSIRWLAEWCIRLIRLMGGVFNRKPPKQKKTKNQPRVQAVRADQNQVYKNKPGMATNSSAEDYEN
ncbi:MAG: hypothetical protein JW991_04890 [Candidatus Pacebacteria bacterium]|nr:hypothetical protein [Candidatus Paceibacterota bacterium]